MPYISLLKQKGKILLLLAHQMGFGHLNITIELGFEVLFNWSWLATYAGPSRWSGCPAGWRRRPRWAASRSLACWGIREVSDLVGQSRSPWYFYFHTFIRWLICFTFPFHFARLQARRLLRWKRVSNTRTPFLPTTPWETVVWEWTG